MFSCTYSRRRSNRRSAILSEVLKMPGARVQRGRNGGWGNHRGNMESVKDISRDAWGGDSEPLRAEFEDESLRWSRDDEEPERSEPCRDADASGVIRCNLTSDGGCASASDQSSGGSRSWMDT